MNYQLKSRQVQIAMDAASGLYETQTRFDICDATGKVLDNAQGYGYKTAQSAHKAAAYKFKGGRKRTKPRRFGVSIKSSQRNYPKC